MSDSTTQSPTAYAMGVLERGDAVKAIAVMRQLIEREPNSAEHHYHLSLIFMRMGQRDDATRSLQAAIALNPQLGAAHLNLGVLLLERGEFTAAERSFRTAIATGRDVEGAWRNLGRSLRGQDRFDEAEQAYRTALTRDPNSPEAWMMLGSLLREGGEITESLAATRRAIALRPGYREAHSNLCYALYFDPHTSPADLIATHRDWAAKFAPPPTATISRPLHDPIRIGYVSPYFRNHVVAAFMEPILQHHDRSQFAITCYSDANPEDEITARLRKTNTTWRQTAGQTDRSLAKLVEQDEIDILVDLTLHMRGCRLGVFASKPAPIQITHLAYCGTSGLAQMDGCITDIHMLAPGCEAFFSETLLPLPTSYWCYQPPMVAPDVGPLPVLQNGYVTFGSLNTAAKVNDDVVSVWSKLLLPIPNSKLTIHVPQGSRSLPARFARHGIDASRLILIPRQSLSEYFQTWNQIDIALDPFPYNGGTTTFDALWMGVPVVTLAGSLPVGRAGVSILRNLKLERFIAESEDQYLSIAAGLATDLNNLSLLRKSARKYIANSPLLDAPRYVSELEAVYRLAAMRRTL